MGRRPGAEPGADTGVGRMPAETEDEDGERLAKEADCEDFEEVREGRRGGVKEAESERSECE